MSAPRRQAHARRRQAEALAAAVHGLFAGIRAAAEIHQVDAEALARLPAHEARLTQELCGAIRSFRPCLVKGATR